MLSVLILILVIGVMFKMTGFMLGLGFKVLGLVISLIGSACFFLSSDIMLCINV